MFRQFLFISLLFLTSFVWSNTPPPTSARITEIHWDNQGNWTMEIYFYHIYAEDDTIIVTTSTDTARFKVFPSYADDYFILTESQLDKELNIFKTGDAVCLYVPDAYWPQYWETVSDTLNYGNYPGATVSAPYGNQSIVDLGSVYRLTNMGWYEEIEFKVKDSSPSIGFHRDPARGTFKGQLLDQNSIPIPYMQIEYDRGHGLQEIWTDEFGFFEDSTMYAKYYTFRIGNSSSPLLDTLISIEPDSITYCEFILPIDARNTVEGYCTNTSSNLAGTFIIFTPNHDFTSADTLYTDTNGYFSGMIDAGYYYVRYSRPGYQPYYTPTTSSIFNDKNYITQHLSGGNRIEIPRGPVSGIWDCDTALYWVFENIWIEENDTLIIGPGTWIEFMGAFSFDIYGTLLAQGTEEDMILITDGHEGSIDWNQLSLHGESTSGSIIDFTIIEKNDSGVFLLNSSPIIKNSTFENNNAKITITGFAEPEISNNFFYDRLYCYDYSNAEIHHNIFYENNSGLAVLDSSTANVFHNNFIHSRTAIWSGTWNGYPHFTYIDLINNIFYGVEYCFSAVGNSSVSAKHNLFFDSNLYDLPYYLAGMGEITRLNFNQDSCDKFFNIFMDPLFVNPNILDFYLLPESPCIDAGALSFPHDPDATIADIGAIYHDQLGLRLPEGIDNIEKITISNYPNPVNGSTAFKIAIPKSYHWGEGRIKIFNLSGQIADIIYINNSNAEIIEVPWSVSGINGKNSTGIYCYVCEIDRKVVASNKMILINE